MAFPHYTSPLASLSLPAHKERCCNSAAVATREKEVMREAMNSGYRLIALRENGFSPLYKPAGESFAACSQGTLLQVSPWEYHMNRRTISREHMGIPHEPSHHLSRAVPATEQNGGVDCGTLTIKRIAQGKSSLSVSYYPLRCNVAIRSFEEGRKMGNIG